MVNTGISNEGVAFVEHPGNLAIGKSNDSNEMRLL